eukprot:g38816.t1
MESPSLHSPLSSPSPPSVGDPGLREKPKRHQSLQRLRQLASLAKRLRILGLPCDDCDRDEMLQRLEEYRQKRSSQGSEPVQARSSEPAEKSVHHASKRKARRLGKRRLENILIPAEESMGQSAVIHIQQARLQRQQRMLAPVSDKTATEDSGPSLWARNTPTYPSSSSSSSSSSSRTTQLLPSPSPSPPKPNPPKPNTVTAATTSQGGTSNPEKVDKLEKTEKALPEFTANPALSRGIGETAGRRQQRKGRGMVRYARWSRLQLAVPRPRKAHKAGHEKSVLDAADFAKSYLPDLLAANNTRAGPAGDENALLTSPAVADNRSVAKMHFRPKVSAKSRDQDTFCAKKSFRDRTVSGRILPRLQKGEILESLGSASEKSASESDQDVDMVDVTDDTAETLGVPAVLGMGKMKEESAGEEEAEKGSMEKEEMMEKEEDIGLPVEGRLAEGITCVSTETIAAALQGQLDLCGKLLLLDCRFRYEFEGGHIRGARHIPDEQHLHDLLFPSGTPHQAPPARRKKNLYVVLYCEHSTLRAPTLYTYIREFDCRQKPLSSSSFCSSPLPSLSYPFLYLLVGGYKQFFDHFSYLCHPGQYVSMIQPAHRAERQRYWQAWREREHVRKGALPPLIGWPESPAGETADQNGKSPGRSGKRPAVVEKEREKEKAGADESDYCVEEIEAWMGMADTMFLHTRDPQVLGTVVECLQQQEVAFERKADMVRASLSSKRRLILLDWMGEVVAAQQKHPQTQFLAVSCLDRFLSQLRVAADKLQLAAVAALLIASKYEERYPIPARELLILTDSSYTMHELVCAERAMLEKLDYRVSAPTSLEFLACWSALCPPPQPHSRTVLALATYLCEIFLQDEQSLAFPPSKIAAAAYWLAHLTVTPAPWGQLETITGYSLGQLRTTLQSLLSAHQRFHAQTRPAAPSADLPMVYARFAGKAWLRVAILAPVSLARLSAALL